jgi:hypothetical protein
VFRSILFAAASPFAGVGIIASFAAATRLGSCLRFAAAGIRSHLRRCLVFNQQRTKQKIFAAVGRSLSSFAFAGVPLQSTPLLDFQPEA